MAQIMSRGELLVHSSAFPQSFNAQLFEQYSTAKDRDNIKKTHFFNGRFENVYIHDKHVPLLVDLKTDARAQADKILCEPVRKMGCWFNAMHPGSDTSLHSHDDDDERLSGVYYVSVPRNSGKLLIHAGEEIIEHTPSEGQWVFFTPQTPHSVSENLSNEVRLSVAFNFS